MTYGTWPLALYRTSVPKGTRFHWKTERADLPKGGPIVCLGVPPHGVGRDEWLARHVREVPHWQAKAAVGRITADGGWPLELCEEIEAEQARIREVREARRARRTRRTAWPFRPVRWRGIILMGRRVWLGGRPTVEWVAGDGATFHGRAGLRALIHHIAASTRSRQLAEGIILCRQGKPGKRAWWIEAHVGDTFVGSWPLGNTWPQEVAAGVAWARRAQRAFWASQPDPTAPDHLGWRVWKVTHEGILTSPYRQALWPDGELRVTQWDESDVLRGRAGIHALRVPRDWRHAKWRYAQDDSVTCPAANYAHGLVERFGRYVLGTTGWRAEWVVIRGLVASSPRVAERLRHTYPDIPIHVEE